jgi:hypothetical protein
LFTLACALGVIELDGITKMSKKSKDYQPRVNICWEYEEERYCKTLSKDEAYALKKEMKEKEGVVFWFQPLED